MITYTAKDFGMKKIMSDKFLKAYSGLIDSDIHFFGIVDKVGRADLEIRCMNEFDKFMVDLVHALKSTGLSVRAESNEDVGDKDSYDGYVIGINRHLRTDISVCRRLVITIVSFMADKLVWDRHLMVRRKEPFIAPKPVVVTKGKKSEAPLPSLMVACPCGDCARRRKSIKGKKKSRVTATLPSPTPRLDALRELVNPPAVAGPEAIQKPSDATPKEGN